MHLLAAALAGKRPTEQLVDLTTINGQCSGSGGPCTATVTMVTDGTFTGTSEDWYTPSGFQSKRTYHTRWNTVSSTCTTNMSGDTVNTWVELDGNKSTTLGCSAPDIDACTIQIEVSYDGGTTTHETFNLSLTADCSP